MAKYGYANRIGYVKKKCKRNYAQKMQNRCWRKKTKMVTRKINNQMN